MREECRTGYGNQMEKTVIVSQVDAFRTRNGNTRYVLRDEDGNEYTTFKEAIARDALGAEGRRARIEYHEQRRGDFTNVYLDGVTPLEEDDDGGDAVAHVDEVAWKTAVEAAPLIAGPERGIEPEELYEKLKPFKDLVADDIERGNEDRE
jgi:hypothetical protein